MLIKISHDNDYTDDVPTGCYRDPNAVLSPKQIAWSGNDLINHENIRVKLEPEELIPFMRNFQKECPNWPISFHLANEDSNYDAVFRIHNDIWE